MALNDTYKLIEINQKTLVIQHNLSKIKPLLRKTRYLAFNAKFTVDNLHMRGGSFSALVKELNNIVIDLEDLLGEVGQSSWEMSRSAATCSNFNHRLHLMVQTLRLTAEQSSSHLGTLCKNLLDGKDWIRETQQERSQINAMFRANTAEKKLWDTIQTFRAQFIEEMNSLFLQTRKLSILVNKINWIAVQQINLIAVTALVESSWAGFAKSNIPVLSKNIRELARKITDVEHLATNQLLDLEARLHQLDKPVRAYLYANRTYGQRHDQSSAL
ncbi:MAG: hypothetical protein OEV94_07035 [Deltaproteobacteria bacterium]|nr:hypothetical protein [Deltaproteobacteria bacterium]